MAGLKRIGVFGGAFDPPHLAHHALAQTAIAQFALDELRVIPTGQAWHKTRALSAAEHRLAMTRLAFSDLPQVVVDERELLRTGATYTVQTLRELHQEWAQASFWLFIGADQARAFTTWQEWSEILQLAQLVVAHRPDDDEQALTWQNEHLRDAVHLQMPAMQVSATAIRHALAGAPGQAPQALKASVLSYIDQHRLYSRQL